MKRVLYLTNIEVPYRVRFFNELAKFYDLTVVYEREKSGNRNNEWAKSEKGTYMIRYLNGFNIGNEHSFSLRIFKEIFAHYDKIIVGCYNSPVQLMAIMVMRLLRISYCLNLDGEPFLKGASLKQKLKRFVISGAETYLVAGEQAAISLKKSIGENHYIIPYYFSSLSEEEIRNHCDQSQKQGRNSTILVVGQYFDYKGLDVALEVARLDPTLHYKFVGMGSRTEQFIKKNVIPNNVEIIPFLQKTELEQEYQSCAMLVLPSRQECWGLVINEAASFVTPIVSTWGSGAAVEFLSEHYPHYLAKTEDPSDLLCCIRNLLVAPDKKEYSDYLLKKSKNYTIDNNVAIHINALQ